MAGKVTRTWIALENLATVHMVVPVPNSTRPDLMEEPIEEPADLEEFLAKIQITIQSDSASFFEDLKAFRPQPRESLVKLADRFDEVT